MTRTVIAHKLSLTGALHTKSLARQVFEHLREKIVAGQLPPGARLGEEALAKELGVSRSPIREAIADLERVGLAQRNGKRERRVTIPDERLIIDTYAVWSLLEAGNAYEASLHATAETHRACYRLLDELEQALAAPDVARYQETSRRLHDVMKAPARNQLLKRILDDHSKFVAWLQAVYSREPEDFSADAIQEHRIVCDFYLKRDLLGLTHALGTHIAHQRDRVLEAWRGQPLSPASSVYNQNRQDRPMD